MGRSVRQKRKNRSGRSVVRQSNNRKRPMNPTGNAIIAENWNKDETLTQNYRRLGLMNRLKLPSGGVERLGVDAVTERTAQNPKAAELARHTDPFKIDNSTFSAAGSTARIGSKTASAVSEVRVERDAAGKIVRILRDAAPAHNPLNDPLNDISDSEDEAEAVFGDTVYEEWGGFEDETKPGKKSKAAAALSFAKTPVVEQLERMANQPVGPKMERYQSGGEREWLQALVDHYKTADPDEGTLARMAFDRRRNPFQRTANDIRRRLARFRAKNGAVSGTK